MRIALAVVVALTLVASAAGKGFTRVVLVGTNGRAIEIHAPENTIEGLISVPGVHERIRSGYVRLFFVAAGDFPANPARYYPAQGCVLLDWGGAHSTCTRIGARLVELLAPAAGLPRFHGPPTVMAELHYRGRLTGMITTVAALEDPFELALDQPGRAAPRPGGCYEFTGHWRGPRAAIRPRRLALCPDGVYAGGRLYPLRRGVWEWFRINVS